MGDKHTGRHGGEGRRTKRKQATGQTGETTTMGILAAFGKAQLLFLLVGMVLTMLFCTIAYQLEDPAAVTTPLSLLALSLGAMAGGLGAVRWTGDGLLAGFLSGGISMGLVWILSLLPLRNTPLESGDRILFFCLIPVLSLCGAVLGKKRRTGRQHRR